MMRALIAAIIACACLSARAETQGATCSLGTDKRTVLLALARCCAQDLHSRSSCRAYDAAQQFAIIKDNSPAKPDAYLIIPTFPVTGIEDAHIFQPPVAGFWADGWQAVQHFVGGPPQRLGMAINSPEARTQNQLHIHLSCVLPAVADILARRDAEIGADPKTPLQLKLPPHENAYAVVTVPSLSGAHSPFAVAAAMPGVAGHMALQGIATIGARRAGRFYVLDTAIEGSDWGGAEELLDQSCH